MRRLAFFVVALLLWLLLTWTVRIEFVITGLAVSLFAALLFGRMAPPNWQKLLQIKRYLWFLWYLLVFVRECLKANLDVAYRVLHPALPIAPGIVQAKVTLRTALARAILANSITMTPGTLSVDIVGEDLFIHWICIQDGNLEVSCQGIVNKFEEILKRIFE